MVQHSIRERIRTDENLGTLKVRADSRMGVHQLISLISEARDEPDTTNLEVEVLLGKDQRVVSSVFVNIKEASAWLLVPMIPTTDGLYALTNCSIDFIENRLPKYGNSLKGALTRFNYMADFNGFAEMPRTVAIPYDDAIKVIKGEL